VSREGSEGLRYLASGVCDGHIAAGVGAYGVRCTEACRYMLSRKAHVAQLCGLYDDTYATRASHLQSAVGPDFDRVGNPLADVCLELQI
jgi:hypothetical protein